MSRFTLTSSLLHITLSATVIILAFPLTHQQTPGGILEITEEVFGYSCENITVIEICKDIYPQASFPNFRGHGTQMEANEELENFIPLIRQVCSNAIVHLLCSIYAPFCQVGIEDIRVPPCRELCDYVRGTCEEALVSFGLEWPPHLDCMIYPLNASTTIDFCPTNLTALEIPDSIDTDPIGPPGVTSDTTIATSRPVQGRMRCPVHLAVTSNLQNRSFSFGGVDNCGMNCTGIYFTPSERNVVAPVFILLFAVVCVLFTLFTVATFLIDRHRFHYPERPIIFISFCYLVVSVIYLVGSISKLSGDNDQAFSCSDGFSDNRFSSSFVLQRLPNSESTYKNASCVILFVVLYFFHMASAIWWIILTLTWFLAAALKWGEEAVEKFWLLYHIIAWGMPSLQIILILALRLVDGDQLSGLCYVGNSNSVGLGVFVFLPLTFYLLMGIVFLVIGFTALLNIRTQLQRDATKSRKIGRLILRVGIYSALYITPNVILLILYLNELAQKEKWEKSYLDNCAFTGANRIGDILEECSGNSRPSFAAFILKYIMLFLVGISSTSWIMSSKTFSAWQKLFCSCFDNNIANPYDIPGKPKYDLPNPQQYILPEKHGDLSLHIPHPHTAV